VMSLGSPVTPGTSPARVRRFCEMARETIVSLLSVETE